MPTRLRWFHEVTGLTRGWDAFGDPANESVLSTSFPREHLYAHELVIDSWASIDLICMRVCSGQGFVVVYRDYALPRRLAALFYSCAGTAPSFLSKTVNHPVPFAYSTFDAERPTSC